MAEKITTIKEKPKGFLTWDIYSPAPKTWLKWEEGNFHRSIVSAEMQCLSDKGKGWKSNFRFRDIPIFFKI